MAITTCPFTWYQQGVKHTAPEQFLADDLRVILLADTYTPDSNLHEYYDVDITGELATANGYTSGGLALSTKTLVEDSTPGNWIFSSANPFWDIVTASITAKYMALYNNTPVSNKPLIAWGYLDYNGGTPQNVTTLPGVALTILIPASGWFTVQKGDAI